MSNYALNISLPHNETDAMSTRGPLIRFAGQNAEVSRWKCRVEWAPSSSSPSPLPTPHRHPHHYCYPHFHVRYTKCTWVVRMWYWEVVGKSVSQSQYSISLLVRNNKIWKLYIYNSIRFLYSYVYTFMYVYVYDCI